MKINHQADYALKRREAYPPITDQLDLIYHSGVDEWRASIASVKAKYPKPDSKP